MASQPRTFEMVGARRLVAVLDALAALGYREGQGVSVAKDGAPGWSDWYYWVDVDEDPARPVTDAVAEALARDG